MKETFDITVVIPTYNEEERVAQTIDTVFAYFRSRNLKGEIVISDDKSIDTTVGIVKEKMKINPDIRLLEMERNYFKGWPVRMGALAAHGSYVLTTDCDLSTPIEEADKLLTEIKKGADLVIGSRIDESGHDMRDSKPIYRRILGKLFTSIRSVLTPDIKDSQCGFKLFKFEVAQTLFSKQRLGNIIFDVEILYIARKLKFRIIQVPVVWNYGGQTRMRVTFKNGVDTLLSLAKIWWWHHSEYNGVRVKG